MNDNNELTRAAGSLRLGRPIREAQNTAPIGEIDNLYDELFKTPSAATEELVGGACPIQSPTLEYLDGRTETVARVVLFHPTIDDLTVEADDAGGERLVPLADLSCVRMDAKPPGFPHSDGPSHIEIVDTGENLNYHVAVPDRQYVESGMYGLATKRKSFANEYFFFPYRSIQQRCQKRYLGQIMTGMGMLTDDELHQALEEQRERQRRRLGEIIAEYAHILPGVVERAIRRAYKADLRMRVGEILVNAGLVNEDIVHESLKIQKNLRKKIGQLLFERGTLNDEQVFRALAEKFRMPYVDLRQEKFSRKALAAVPKDIAVKLRVVPINFTKTSLVVATIFPDVPAIKTILLQRTKQKNIKLVLTRPSQLQAVIKKLYP